MKTNVNNTLTPVSALDALALFEPGFSITRDQPAEAETRPLIDTAPNLERAPNKGEDHQA